MLGLVHRQYAGLQKDPMEEMNLALHLNPDFATAYYFRAVLYLDRGDKSSAEWDLAKAKELGFDYTAHTDLGNVTFFGKELLNPCLYNGK